MARFNENQDCIIYILLFKVIVSPKYFPSKFFKEHHLGERKKKIKNSEKLLEKF